MENFQFQPLSAASGGSNYSNKLAPDPNPNNGIQFATLGRRFAAIGVDWGIPFLVFMQFGNFWAHVALVGAVVNSVWWQGRTGASLGKRAFGLVVAYIPHSIEKKTWRLVQPGVLRCAVRFVAHIIDSILFIGFITLIFGVYSRSLADMLVSTVVIRHDRELETLQSYKADRRYPG